MAQCAPALDVATKLQTASVGTLGSTLFVGPEKSEDSNLSVPPLAVFVSCTGGPAPQPFLGSGTSLYEFAVQVVSRGNPNETEAARVKAVAAIAALHEAAVTDSANSSTYIDCVAVQSAPTFIGATDTELPRWSANFRLRQIY